jgi:hypothetical protein
MGMVCFLYPLPEEQLGHIMEDSKNISYYLFGIQSTPEESVSSEKNTKTDLPKPQGAPLEGSSALYLDKTWNGIHFLFTGNSFEGEWPFNFLMAGENIGDEDVGYGPARALRAAQVKEVSEALKPLTPEEMSKRFDPKKMMELDIYPFIWDRDPKEDDTLGYLMDFYGKLKSFIHQTAENNMALIIYLC